MRQLNNSSLVNESVTSEMNRSLVTQRILKMVTPIKKEKKSFLNVSSTTMCKDETHVRSISLMDQSANSDVSKLIARQKILKMLTPKKEVKNELGESTLKKEVSYCNTSTTNISMESSLNESIRSKQLFLTALKSVTSKNNSSKLIEEKELELSKCLLSASTIKPEMNSLDVSKCNSTLSTKKKSPNVDRCSKDSFASGTLCSPIKRSHQSSTNLSYAESPSKRFRPGENSILSSTRISEESFAEKFDTSPPKESEHLHRSYFDSRTYNTPSHLRMPMMPPRYSNSMYMNRGPMQPIEQGAHLHHSFRKPWSNNPYHGYDRSEPSCPNMSWSRCDSHSRYQNYSYCCPPGYSHPPIQQFHPVPNSMIIPESRTVAPNYCNRAEVAKFSSSRQNNDTSKSLILPDEKQVSSGNSIHVPIVSELLKGLKSSDRRLKLDVRYDVRLDEDKENSP